MFFTYCPKCKSQFEKVFGNFKFNYKEYYISKYGFVIKNVFLIVAK